MRSLTAGLAAGLLLAAGARADVLHVPKDFATIQEAVDAAQAGDEVVISAGTYTTPVVVADKADLTLRGKGKVVFTGGSASDTAITVDTCQQVQLEHLRIVAWAGQGVFVTESTGTTLTHLVLSLVNGIGLHGLNSEGTTVDHCTLTGDSADAIYLDTCVGSSVRRCVIKDGSGSGIIVQGGSDLLVEKCHVDVVGNLGIAVDSDGTPGSCTLHRCLVRKASGIGIVANAAGIHMVKNRVLKGGSDGIVDDAQDGEYISNRVVKANGRGLYLAGDGGFLLQGNRFVHVTGEGVVVNDDVTGGTAIKNKVLKPGKDGFEIFGPAHAFDHNLVTGAAGDGFEVHSSGSTFTYNTAKGSAEFDLLEVAGQDNIYIGNHFKTTSLR